ncbi:OsmC family protein [Streptomyces sp. NPDC059740]|uniref:OsmC family protein n=1 Tax=Streptomyces sp. NPDC059740 TaxID=3346926 RepID=UPI0036609AB8
MAPSDETMYSAHAHHRHGEAHLDVEGRDPLPYASPSQLGGDGRGYDPEQLYAAALTGCLHQALLIAATESGTDPAGSAVTTEVRLHTDGTQRYTFEATATVELPGAAEDRRGQVLDLALRMCPVGDQVTVRLG